MKEPVRYSMSTGEPVQDRIHKTPLPALYTESMKDDLYTPSDIPTANNNEQQFWQFIAKHKQSRVDWVTKDKNEDNTQSGET